MEQYYERREVADFRDLIRQSVGIYGNKNAFSIKGIMGEYNKITYKEFNNDIEALGTAFINMTLKCEKILIIANNSYEWCVSYFAILNGVGGVVTASKDISEEEIIKIIKENYIRAIIFSDEIKQKIVNLMSKVNEIKYYINIDEAEESDDIIFFKDLLKKGYELLKIGDVKFSNSHIDYDEIAILSYVKEGASPIAFNPKQISYGIYLLASSLDINDKDKIFFDTDMYNQPDFFVSVLLSLYIGATCNFRTGEVLEDIKDAEPTIIIGNTLFYKEIYKNFFIRVEKTNKKTRIRSLLGVSNIFGRLNEKMRNRCLEEILKDVGCPELKFAICTDEIKNVKLIEALINLGIKLVHGYGIQEVFPLLFINKSFYKRNSIGTPIKDIKAKIDSEKKLLINITKLIEKNNTLLEKQELFTNEGFFKINRAAMVDKEGFYYLQ